MNTGQPQQQPQQQRPIVQRASFGFPFAEQPDIIRSAQKDDYYRHILGTQAFDVVRQVLGPRVSMQWKEEVQLLSDATFYGLSYLRGWQTLGEEYCDIMQVQSNRLTPPDQMEGILLLVYHIVVPYLLNKLIQKLTILSRPPLEQHLQQQQRQQRQPQRQQKGTLQSLLSLQLLPQELSENNRKKLEKYLPFLISFSSTFERVHVAIFYFTGVYYHLAKRMLNIRYIQQEVE